MSDNNQTQSVYALDLAPNFAPDVDLIITEGVAGFGIKGAGKSNACGRLLEQLSRFPIPYLVPDTKGEYISLKEVYHGTRFVIATANNCPSGEQILRERLQVVMDLRSWGSAEGAALAMIQVLGELFATAVSLDPAECPPCPCVLDEAQYWLPQESVSYLSKDIAKELRDIWHVVATRARSLGLVPSFFTQNISELHKSVMRQCGLYILMRQVLDADLKRYLDEYIHSPLPAKQVKSAIRSFAPGQAIIVLPSGEQVSTRFHARESIHTSKTPTVRGLMQRLQCEAPPLSAPVPPVSISIVSHQSPVFYGAPLELIIPDFRPLFERKVRPTKKEVLQRKAILRQMLQENPHLPTTVIAERLACTNDSVRAWKAEIFAEASFTLPESQVQFERQPELQSERQRELEVQLEPEPERESEPIPAMQKSRKRKQVLPTIVECIYQLLEHDSDLSPREVSSLVGCDLETAKQARTDFFYGHLKKALPARKLQRVEVEHV